MLRAALLAIAAVLAAPAAGAAAACPKGAQCSTIQVPLDHTGATPGALPLAYARVPATGTRAGTIVLLAGGPGQAAIPLTRAVTALLAPLRETYDLVLVDQRGTGASGATACALDGPADVPACAAKLGAKRAFMNTTETARDLEDLRGALGVDKLTLLGVSYGTKVAGEYARRYPQRTAALVLDSPVSVDGLDGVERLPVLGAPRVLREACYPGACHRTVRDPQAALKAAAERLQRGALTGPLVAASGRVRTARVTEAHLFNALAETDTNPLLRTRMPAAIASLAAGDAAPLLHAAALTSGGGGSGDFGVNGARLLATMCVEGQLPWAPDSPVAGRQAALQSYVSGLGPAPFAPFRPRTVLDNSAAGLCTAWPPTPAPQGVPSAGPDVPVLVISGRDDLRTPTEDARRTAAQFPHAQVLAVPGVGHSVLTSDPSGCALAGMTGFLAGKPAVPCSKRKPEPGSFTFQLPALPYVPARLDQLPASRDGRAGRTLNAFALTMQQLSYDALAGFEALLSGGGARIPGLRAGWWRFTLRRLELHGVEVIRGVRVTGTFQDDSKGASRFTISGPEAAAGTIVITRKGLTATLGGRNLARDSL